MCKILIITGIKPENVENAWKFSKAMAKEMSYTEKDGLGYVALSAEGEMFGERWLNNPDAFVVRNPITELDNYYLETFEGALAKDEVYNRWGSVSEVNTTSILLHARWATSSKHFLNTHPFVFDNTALIHNGVIRNADKLEMIQSSCDSETILNEYIREEVTDNPDKIQTVADRLDGYYACGVITKNFQGQWFVDVFKDSMAELHAFYINEVGLIFATSEKNVLDVCKVLGYVIASTYKVRTGYMMRMDAISGEPVHVEKFRATFLGRHKSKKDESVEDLGDWLRDESGFFRRKTY